MTVPILEYETLINNTCWAETEPPSREYWAVGPCAPSYLCKDSLYLNTKKLLFFSLSSYTLASSICVTVSLL